MTKLPGVYMCLLRMGLSSIHYLLHLVYMLKIFIIWFFFLCQSQVQAGSINLNGSLTIVVQRPGGETAMADIVRLVEEAQSQEAPVQRLADKVIILS